LKKLKQKGSLELIIHGLVNHKLWIITGES
jgi:hypothetical protein